MSLKVKAQSVCFRELRVIGREELHPDSVFANLQVDRRFPIDDGLVKKILLVAFDGKVPPGLVPRLVGGLDAPLCTGRLNFTDERPESRKEGTFASLPDIDDELMKEFLLGCFNQIYNRYAPELHRFFASRVPLEAEELTQQTLFKFFAMREQYDPSRGSMRAWLYRIARNELHDGGQHPADLWDEARERIAEVFTESAFEQFYDPHAPEFHRFSAARVPPEAKELTEQAWISRYSAAVLPGTRLQAEHTNDSYLSRLFTELRRKGALNSTGPVFDGVGDHWFSFDAERFCSLLPIGIVPFTDYPNHQFGKAGTLFAQRAKLTSQVGLPATRALVLLQVRCP
jgi:Sigma-70 region 2